jgi:predicted transcriptional regulator
MTALLDRALEAARTLPPAAQDDIARVVLRLAGTDDGALPVDLAAEERAAIAASKAAAARGEFATDEEIRAVWAKHDL